MAYQLQTLPQFAPYDPLGSIGKGYSQGQQNNTNRLNQQKLKKDLDNYDRVLNAELSKMLAATEASEASKNLSNTQRLGADFDNMIKAQYGGEKAQADINASRALEDQRRAAAEKSRRQDQSGFGGITTGAAGQLAAYNLAKERGDPNADLILESLQGGASGSSRTTGWGSYPMDVKRGLIAKATGLGMDQAQAAQLLSQGASLEDIATMMGVPVEEMNNSEYSSIYNPSQPAVTAAQKRVAAEAEIDYLSPIVAEWIEPYADPIKLFGYSPSQISDAVKGENIDQQAKFFAASAIFPELTYMRLRLAGGESGITALEHMESALAGKVKQFEPFMGRDTYMLMNKYLNEKLSEASHIANQMIFDPVAAAESYKQSNETTEEEDLDPLGILK